MRENSEVSLLHEPSWDADSISPYPHAKKPRESAEPEKWTRASDKRAYPVTAGSLKKQRASPLQARVGQCESGKIQRWNRESKPGKRKLRIRCGKTCSWRLVIKVSLALCVARVSEVYSSSINHEFKLCNIYILRGVAHRMLHGGFTFA